MEVAPDIEAYYGAIISEAQINDNALIITFADGEKVRIYDAGQDCCETRYMSTDDDVRSLIGHKLIRIEGKPGANRDDGIDEYHEINFIEIVTDAGFVTLVNHNEHNGYYGGFIMMVSRG